MVKWNYQEWSDRMDAWLASLPSDSPILKMDEIEQCVAFSDYEEAMAGLADYERNGGVSLDEVLAKIETKH
jgi:hypothetical protein